MKTIDMDTWDRKEHFAHFRTMDYPQYDICAPVDISKFLKFVKGGGLPFYHAMIFAATTAANGVRNLRYRLRDGAVIEHDRLHPSFTSLDKDSELFKYVTVDMDGDMDTFIKAAREKERTQRGLFGDGRDEARDDLVYLTCVPWVAFTHISHTIKLDKDDSIPRISWGKFYPDGCRTLLPLSLQVNHALADGVHVGQYFKALQDFLDAF
ncbi:chloramphenicol O-acetyltransferase type A [Sporobacter termitidis DSM 10068]|uniref:Chloramphenicol O-acetyltransferase type A n=1 Tax=Sporobacter termitidis DSM 10068 TaxID=1123282 RepID=A0A1M5XPP3_9FIRM|nr:chloramphenicol acetyltransferase [Sporobacter termitidis]SHI01781.1 chloramphenicol O-acetyltransferase type A [Sporobacter termitidis DSM 10068]